MSLHANLLSEPVSSLALREPVLIKPELTVQEAIRQMRQRRLGCTLVVDDQHRPIGMFTESMLINLLIDDPHGVERPISEFMSDHWPSVRMTDPIVDVLGALEAKNIRFVCVVDEQGRVAGLTGQRGLMEYIADHFPGEVMVQRIGGSAYPREREGA